MEADDGGLGAGVDRGTGRDGAMSKPDGGSGGGVGEGREDIVADAAKLWVWFAKEISAGKITRFGRSAFVPARRRGTRGWTERTSSTHFPRCSKEDRFVKSKRRANAIASR